MLEHNQGVVIFTPGETATHPVAEWSAYCAAKARLDHFVRKLVAEINQHGLPLRAHMLYPGIVDTAMQRQIRDETQEEFSGRSVRGCTEPAPPAGGYQGRVPPRDRRPAVTADEGHTGEHRAEHEEIAVAGRGMWSCRVQILDRRAKEEIIKGEVAGARILVLARLLGFAGP